MGLLVAGRQCRVPQGAFLEWCGEWDHGDDGYGGDDDCYSGGDGLV